MNIGILTGGGDAPGLNAVIRAVVRRSLNYGFNVYGIRNGWKGLIDGTIEQMDLNSISGILHRGGTILGTSRTNLFKVENGEKLLKENIEKHNIDVICAVGGEDTLGVANRLSEMGYKVVGVPKTIDNDLNATDFTFGFDTAVNIAMEAIDRLHTTAESHNRVMVVEVMGRHAGWIALYAGLAGGADVILIPEKPFDLEEVAEVIRSRHKRGKNFSIVVVSEGAKIKTEESVDKDGSLIVSSLEKDAFGHVRLGGIGNVLAQEIEKRTGFETRATILGHIQRGGSPTAYDRILGTRFGVAAVDLIKQGKFGRMVALKGNEIVDVPLKEAVGELKLVDLKFYEVAEVFFG